jgi:pyruvate formate lyase activating enzyme
MTEPLRLEGFPGRYWHRLEDGHIQCDVCPRYCRLNEGQRGLCFVRGRQDDQIVLTTYGRSSGFCVDPIEKKPLNHYLPGTPVLSFGTAGCNLTCKFCQNWDISKARQFDRLQDAASPEEIVEAAIAVGSRSIAYTYNDPVIFLEYAVDVAKVARRRGIKNVAVTAGYVDAAAREELYTFMDAANVDLKAFTETFYKRLCTGHLGAVLDTLEYLKHNTKVWLEITTLLIPGHNDSSEEVKKLSEWVISRWALWLAIACFRKLALRASSVMPAASVNMVSIVSFAFLAMSPSSSTFQRPFQISHLRQGCTYLMSLPWSWTRRLALPRSVNMSDLDSRIAASARLACRFDMMLLLR